MGTPDTASRRAKPGVASTITAPADFSHTGRSRSDFPRNKNLVAELVCQSAGLFAPCTIGLLVSADDSAEISYVLGYCGGDRFRSAGCEHNDSAAGRLTGNEFQDFGTVGQLIDPRNRQFRKCALEVVTPPQELE